MALKGILKSTPAAAEAGPSKPRAAAGAKPKATVKATIAAPAPKARKSVKVAKPDSDAEMASEDDNDFGEDEYDTDEEIERANAPGEKKPLKRKRVTTATDFGSTLTSLLSESAVKPKKSKKAKRTAAEDKAAADASDADDDDDVPAPAPVDLTRPAPKSNPILALSAKPLPPSRAAVSLERRAARALKAEKEERLDRARVRNVLEGWTPAPGANVGSQEFERGLRKTAQRGVIKLFNAILVASKNAEEAAVTLSQKAGVKPEAPRNKKERDNILGRGAREDVLTKESFLDLVRKGGAK